MAESPSSRSHPFALPARVARREELAAYARALDLADPGGDALPEGESLARCTNGAAAVAERFGGTVVGYARVENPTATLGMDCDGHDFALVDEGRLLVDPCACHVECVTAQAVFDREDLADALLVRALYGDPACWRPVPHAAAPEWAKRFNAGHADAGTRVERGSAMPRVRHPTPTPRR